MTTATISKQQFITLMSQWVQQLVEWRMQTIATMSEEPKRVKGERVFTITADSGTADTPVVVQITITDDKFGIANLGAWGVNYTPPYKRHDYRLSPDLDDWLRHFVVRVLPQVPKADPERLRNNRIKAMFRQICVILATEQLEPEPVEGNENSFSLPAIGMRWEFTGPDCQVLSVWVDGSPTLPDNHEINRHGELHSGFAPGSWLVPDLVRESLERKGPFLKARLRGPVRVVKTAPRLSRIGAVE